MAFSKKKKDGNCCCFASLFACLYFHLFVRFVLFLRLFVIVSSVGLPFVISSFVCFFIRLVISSFFIPLSLWLTDHNPSWQEGDPLYFNLQFFKFVHPWTKYYRPTNYWQFSCYVLKGTKQILYYITHQTKSCRTCDMITAAIIFIKNFQTAPCSFSPFQMPLLVFLYLFSSFFLKKMLKLKYRLHTSGLYIAYYLFK